MLHKFWLDSGLPHSRINYNLYTERNKSLQSLQRSSFKSAAMLVRVAVSLQHSPLSAAHYSQLARLGIPHPWLVRGDSEG